uniref:OVOS protein n=1 Tax=Falco tinnunculus TaxID=100819 RepID=A0A8C4UZH8_FALTI
MTKLCDLLLPSHSQYVLLVPTVVRSDSPQTACVQLHSFREPLSLSIVLEYGSIRKTLFEESVRQNDYFKCCEFKVPPATSDPLAFISFSAKGTTVDIAERRSVAIQNVDNSVFIQTDKPIYKPGQKGVLVCLSPTLQDPEKNKIFQWLEVTSKHGIVQLSFPLIPEPILGSYYIIVERSSGEKEYQFFTVEEYVLPKFEVTTDVPQSISFFDEEVRVNVCASYTYGQPVQANARINVCQKHFYRPQCEHKQKETCEILGKDGCLSTIISTKKFQLYRSYARMYASLNVESIVTENGTGNTKWSISHSFFFFFFLNPLGILCVQITVTNLDGKPVADRTVLLELNERYLAHYTTDKNGTAAFSINTSNFFDPSFDLFPWGCLLPCLSPQASFFVRRFYSRTNSFVKIEPVKEKLSCGQQQTINVHYILNREGYRNVFLTSFVGLSFHVCSTAPRGTFSITLTVTEELAPSTNLLLYTVHPHGEIVADSSWIRSDICFKNKVQLEFSEKQGLPGSKVGLHLEAAANSYCALRAVDQSVLLLQPERQLSAESVYYQLPVSDLYGYYHNGLNLEDDKPERCTPVKTTFFDGLYYEPVNVSRDGDAYRIFRVCALCGSLSGRHSRRIHAHYGVAHNTIRKFFPETWIWDLVHTDSRGEVNVPYTIPDTITEWKASAFCMQDDAGFGISSPVTLTAFQPFFVDLTLPYSVIRGEKFNLIANVFNYLNKCIQVCQVPFYFLYVLWTGGWVKQGGSHGPRDILVETERTGCKGCTVWIGTSTYCFTMLNCHVFMVMFYTFLPVLDHCPAIKQPEGIKKELTQSSLVCSKGKASSFVPGVSGTPSLFVGDILGTALRNMENLLHMPYGCGEQNMALFTPNIYALDYLNKTGQLTEEIRIKGTGYLSTGYQKQLSYKHRDGSYSSFGTRDREGSVWLTAFVYKSFAQARRYIYIDDDVQSQTLIWLASKQKSDGCFENAGSHFNNALKGGEEGEYSLTAYVVAALLEAGHSASGMNCLETAFTKGVRNLYNQALFAYIYGLVDKKERCQFFLEKLDKTATRHVHWQREYKPPAEHFPVFYSRAPSAEIEITSYVLLALLNKARLSPEDLSYISRIVHWLVKQQNPYGGFSSSQVTTGCALAQYGYLTFSKNNLNTVKVNFMDSTSKTFQVNNKNRFLLQQASLPTIPGNYSAKVNGTGCVYLQTTLRYNIHLPKKAAGFSLSVRFSHFSYTGNRKVSNMAIIDVKMLSGFVPVRSSLRKVKNGSIVNGGSDPLVSSVFGPGLCLLQQPAANNHTLAYTPMYSKPDAWCLQMLAPQTEFL